MKLLDKITIVISIIGIFIFNEYLERNYRTFPELKPVGGLPQNYEWIYREGPDFYVYSGYNNIDSLTQVGLYFGLHPDIDHDNYQTIEHSQLLGKYVKWYTSYNDNNYYSSTLTSFRPNYKHIKIDLHFWISSNSDKKIAEIREALETVEIEFR